MRRILRIWPLYYLICILGFFVLPKFTFIQIPHLQHDFMAYYSSNFILYVLILPNLAFSLYTAVPHIGQLWSIGIEEQFYAFWPWLISKSKNLVKTLILVVVIILLLKVLVLILGFKYSQTNWYQPLKLLVAMSKFECMAIGGIGAFWLFTKEEKLLKYFYKRGVLNLSIILIPILIYYTPDKLQDGIHVFYSFNFLVIIINVCSNKSLCFNLENKIFSYLGKISYGIYMYHFMIIPVILYVFKCGGIIPEGFWNNALLYISSILTTIIVSGLSYYFFESKFIKMKEKYTRIKSGKN